jgi:hypothetical protein
MVASQHILLAVRIPVLGITGALLWNHLRQRLLVASLRLTPNLIRAELPICLHLPALPIQMSESLEQN